MRNRPMLKIAALAAVATLAVTGCRDSGESGESASGGPGVSEEPCPDAVNEDNGCIYLGTISDLTKGPFAPLAVPITAAQKAFWDRVNTDGGVGGYDVNVTEYVADSEYNPEIHNRKYQEMRDEILALAQTLGSSQTLTILEDMKSDNVIGVPASWNSAWDFEPQILASGANYCFEAANGVDWAVEQGASGTVMAIGYPNDYGKDAAAGVQLAAEANGLEFTQVETPPGQDNQAGAIAKILADKPSLVFVTTGPAELATIIGGAAQQGFQGMFVGSSPTWNPALLQTPAAPALEAMYHQAAPGLPFGSDTPGHQAMREALGDLDQPNDGYTVGWSWSYPLLAALEAAAESEDGISRESLVEAARSLETVDYEGMLPEPETMELEDGATDLIWRQSVINAVDPAAPTGVTATGEYFTGPTVEEMDYTEPCFSLS